MRFCFFIFIFSKELENNIVFENLNINGENKYAANLAFHGGIIKEADPDIGVTSEVNHYNDYLNIKSIVFVNRNQ